MMGEFSDKLKELKQSLRAKNQRGLYKYGRLASKFKESLWKILSEWSGEDLMTDKGRARLNEMVTYIDEHEEDHLYYSFKGENVKFWTDAKYCAIFTGLTTQKTNEPIYVCFERKKTDPKATDYQLLIQDFYDLASFRRWVKKRSLGYSIGASGLVFLNGKDKNGKEVDGREEAFNFLTKLAEKALPEPWAYKPGEKAKSAREANDPKQAYPILHNYLEYLFMYLDDHGKVAHSGNKIGFNTNLLDRNFNPICIVADQVADQKDEHLFVNPDTIEDTKEAITLGFEDQYPFDEPHFWDEANDIVYHPSWEIYGLDNSKTIEHITNGEHLLRRSGGDCEAEKTPKVLNDEERRSLIRTMETAIENSKKIASRNYYFVVPQCRYTPEDGWRIQFLMPLYFNEKYGDMPDYALVLNPETMEVPTKDGKKETRNCYQIKTTLSFSQAYGNARLLTKPESTWLNPANVKAEQVSEED